MLTDAQEDAILYIALSERNPNFYNNNERLLVEEYLADKRIEKRDVKGLSLLLELLEYSKDEGQKGRLFDFIVWYVIKEDYFLHRIDDCCGFVYTSIEEMVSTYAQVLGASIDAVSNAIERLKKQEKIVEGKQCITLNFPYSCFEIEIDKELQKKLKNDEVIETAEGICFVPQPYAAMYE
jgi:hypothetical protein